MGIKGILFDRDGTLIDLEGTWIGPVLHILEALSGGRPDVSAEMAAFMGVDRENRRFLPGAKALTDAPTVYCPGLADIAGEIYSPAFLKRFDDLSLQYCDLSIAPLPGCVETLKTLQDAGFVLGLATNGTESSARRQMTRLGIADCFSFWAGFDSGYGAKPAPGQIMAFCESQSLSPDEVVMIGDSHHDMEAARRAGTWAMGVTTGVLSAAELAGEADQILDNLRDLPLLLAGAFQTGFARS